MFSKDKVSMYLNGPTYVMLLVLSVLFVVVAEIAMISDVFLKYELQNYLSDLSRFRFCSIVQRGVQIGIYYVFKYLFGINKCEAQRDAEITEGYDGWVNYVLSQTREFVEISEHNILSDIRILETRLEQQGLLAS